jgi:ParB-like chromosome segregation protein Spo0J
MAKKQSQKEIIDLPLEKLRPHPLQAKIYRGRADWEIEELARDMADRGQDEPVEVLPAGTVISGHGRVEAAKRLGWTTVRCWVRRDLEEAGRQAAEKRLIETNLHRRQLSRLDMVRSYRHLKQIARDKWGRQPHEHKVKGDLRDLIAARFGVSGRTLDRWLRVLELPMLLQAAVEEGSLKLTDGVRVAALPEKVREQIASRVAAARARAGDDLKQRTQAVRAILDDHLPKGADKEEDVVAKLDCFVRALVKGREELGGRVQDLKCAALFTTVLDDLARGRELITA